MRKTVRGVRDKPHEGRWTCGPRQFDSKKNIRHFRWAAIFFFSVTHFRKISILDQIQKKKKKFK